MLKRIFKIVLWITGVILFIFMFTIGGLFLEVRPSIPKLAIDSLEVTTPPQVSYTDDSLAFIGKNKFRKNRHGLYEMYIEGDAFNRGLVAGALSSDLVKYQEEVFVQKITEIIPSERYRSFLQTLIIWFNSKLHKNIHPEFVEEIYGIAKSASPEFDFYGPAFYRLLNYHAAHDIGHTLQAYNLVGCSSFAVWNSFSQDSNLLVGRNFDFYFGTDFSANKIVAFVNPTVGYKFAFVTWGGMTGAVSGMNESGLTVTINAGTPSIAKRSGTPVSLLAREILQFASTINQADSIAAHRKTFVSESFLVASAKDNRAVIIEKTPFEQEVVEGVHGKLLCTNHYQGVKTGSTKENAAVKQKATQYRFERLDELIMQSHPISVQGATDILRNQQGLNDENLGLANEMALNQLIAHHSVVFSPDDKMMWISTPPYVLGSYMAYNLDSVFSRFPDLDVNMPIDDLTRETAADSFLYSKEYEKYAQYVQMKEEYVFFNFTGKPVHDSIYSRMITLNPDSFEPYLWKADQAMENENYELALENYNLALEKVMPIATRLVLEEKLVSCSNKLSN